MSPSIGNRNVQPDDICPRAPDQEEGSLGDLQTTLSHPLSTSHRSLPPERRESLDIREGTIRLSVGIESSGYVVAALDEALAGV